MRRNNLMRGLALTLAFTMSLSTSSFTAFAAEETTAVEAEVEAETAEPEESDLEAQPEENIAEEEAAAEAAAEETAEPEEAVEEAEEAEAVEPEAESESAEETAGETAEESAEAAEEEAEDEILEEAVPEENVQKEAEKAAVTASTVTVAGAEYFYADVSEAGDADVTITAGDQEYAAADFTAIGDTGIVYYSKNPLSGSLYGTSEDQVTSFTQFYSSVGVDASGADYDVISSATEFSGRHVKDIPAIIARNENGIVGILDSVRIDAAEYVEASVLRAAGKTLTEDQEKLLAVVLNEDPSADPEAAGKHVEVASASYNYSCKYGDGEFVINPDDSVDGYVWSDYKNALYGAVISDGSSSAGAIWWTDLYGESATSGAHYNKVEIAVNNGTSKGSNQSTVNRYAAMYNTAKSELKSGTYTVTLYARGYNTVSATVEVKGSFDGEVKAALSADKKAVELTGYEDLKNPKVTVSRTEGRTQVKYAENAEIVEGKVALDTETNALIPATYTVSIENDDYAPIVTTFEYVYSGYVLMNIPYSVFYGTEGAGVADVDAVSSATNKTGNYGFTGGAYHSGTTYDGETAVGGANGSKMQGVIWPVKAENYSDVVALGGKEVTDASSVTTATAGHGSVNVQTLVGYEALSEQDAYSFYVLTEEPSNYFVLNGGSFTAVNAATTGSAEADVIYGSHWGDVQVNVTAAEVSDKLVDAVVFTAEDGTKAGMYHLDQIWRGTQIAWKNAVLDSFDGKKITNIRFYCMVKDADLTDGAAPAYANYVYDYPVDLQIKKAFTGEAKAAFTTDGKQVKISGIDELVNPKATVTRTEGTGRTAKTFTYASDAEIVDGAVTLDTTENELIIATYTVTVNSDNYMPVVLSADYKYTQNLTAKAASFKVAAGKSVAVTVTGAQGDVSFTSSNTSVATVNAKGLVTGKKPGLVKITVKSEGTEEYNAATKVVTIKVVPVATTKITLANLSGGVKLTWNKVTGATGYKIYRNNTLIKTTTGTATTYTDTKVKSGNGTKLTYKIIAYTKYSDNSIATSTLSKSNTTYRLITPTISSVKNTASKKMTVKYNKNTKATGYVVRYAQKSDMSGAKKTIVTKNTTLSKVISGLTKGKTYYVQVQSYKKVGTTYYYSGWSSRKSVKIAK